MSGLFRALCCTVLAAAALPCLAQTDGKTQALSSADAGRWVIGVAGRIDADSNDSLLASFDWGVSATTWLSFVAGYSRSPAERADVSATTLSAGIDHRFGEIGVKVGVGSWGDASALETRDVRTGVYWQRDRFRLGVNYKQRDIDVPFRVTGPLGNTLSRAVGFGGDSIGLSMRVDPASGWHVYATVADYDYDRDLTPLPRIDRLRFLSASTLTLANSFLANERTLGFERELGDKLLSVSLAADRSAVDGSKYETFNAGLLFPVGGRMDLEVDIGRGTSDLLDSATYVGLLLLIYGG